ncbi:MAG TPA: hypothetical protein VL426_02145 [Candidatus Binatia bacterium]|jgi:hypothetical protein|nr:hypothetical protein [Candidatus Binatia bacterium]
MQWLLLFAPLLVQLVALYALSSAMNRLAFGLLGKWLYLLVMWPGVIVHELSHFVGCLLTFTKVFELKLFSPREESPGNLVLGYVSHAKPRNAVAQFIVSSAPFFGGAAALWGILAFVAPRAIRGLGMPLSFGDGGGFTVAVGTAIKSYASFSAALASSLDWRSWKAYVAAWALFAVSVHIAPSRHDMKYALAGGSVVAVLIAVLAWLGGRYAPVLTVGAAAWTARAAAAVTVLLGYGLACVLLATVLLFAAAGLLRAFGRRV